MDKTQREKESLRSWKVNGYYGENPGRIAEIDKERESYFVPKNENAYLMEYEFGSLPELKKMLDVLWNGKPYMREIQKVVLVAAMKNKPQEVCKESDGGKQEEQEQTAHTADQLPSFIYNF